MTERFLLKISHDVELIELKKISERKRPVIFNVRLFINFWVKKVSLRFLIFETLTRYLRYKRYLLK